MLRETKHARERPEEDRGDDAAVEDEERTKRRRPRIRCPKCAWEPRAHDRWHCSCGHCWNTFDTAARCPACDLQWHDTACPSCGEWSPHVDWYESEPDEPKL